MNSQFCPIELYIYNYNTTVLSWCLYYNAGFWNHEGQVSLPLSPHFPPHFASILDLLHRHFWISFSIFTEKSLGIWGGTEENPHITLAGTTIWQHHTSWLMNRETLSLIDVCKLHSAKFCTFQCGSHTHYLFVYQSSSEVFPFFGCYGEWKCSLNFTLGWFVATIQKCNCFFF